jgi:hypothetical protein
MQDQTKEQLQAELDILRKLSEERMVSDHKYAVKLVERVVFGLLALLATAIIGLWLQAQFQPKQSPSVQTVISTQ